MDKPDQFKGPIFWLFGIVIMILLSISAFFLKSALDEVKAIGKNVHTVVVQQSVANARITALEERFDTHQQISLKRFSKIEDRILDFDEGIKAFYQNYDLQRKN